MIEAWKHYEGYSDAVEKVKNQNIDQDLALLDQLYGKSALQYGATAQDVKAEALRQLEIDWRSDRDYNTELFLNVICAMEKHK